MKQQVFNPYLPSWEYIPDGEPHVFGGALDVGTGVKALYFRFCGTGAVDFIAFELK